MAVQVGTTTIGATEVAPTKDFFRGNKYSISERAILRRAFLYCSGLGPGDGVEPGTCRVVIYRSGDDGLPDGERLVAYTPDLEVADGAALAWRQLNFADELLDNGDYWIGFQTGENDEIIVARYDDGAAGARRHFADTFTGGPLDPAPASTAGTPVYSLYVEYDPWVMPDDHDYSADRHHIGLGLHGAVPKGYIISGSVRKDLQRVSTPTEFGGTNDLVAPIPHLARWTQDDYLGGQYGFNWSDDSREFSASRNLLPSQLGVSLRTIPPLVLEDTSVSWWAKTDLLFEPWGATVLAVGGDNRSIYDFDTNALTYDIAPTAGHTYWAATLDVARRYVWAIRQQDSDATVKFIYAFAVADMAIAGSIAQPAGGAGAQGKPCRGLALDFGGDLLLAQFDRHLWTLEVADDFSTTTWTQKKALPGYWKASLQYNGLVYILCADEQSGRTTLVSWDGTDVSTVVAFPFHFIGECLAVYGGRVYVGGRGQDFTGADVYGELYEINGASLRLLRTFAPESLVSGSDFPTAIWRLTVHEGLLFLGGLTPLIAYDQSTDAFYGASEIGSPEVSGVEARVMTSVRRSLVAVGVVGGADPADLYVGATAPAQIDVGGYQSVFTSSDFSPEPSTLKRWSELVVKTRYGPLDSIEYSTDSGDSWVAAPLVATQQGDLYHNVSDFHDAPASRQIRFRVTIDKGTTLAPYTEIVAHTLAFLFLPTPKYAWSFSIAAVDEIEDAEGASIEQDPQAIIDELHAFVSSGSPVHFTDLEGVTHDVEVVGISDLRPLVGPVLDTGGREAFVQVTLAEV